MSRPASQPLHPRPWQTMSIVVVAIALLSSLAGCALEPKQPLPIPPQPQPVAHGSDSVVPTPPDAQGDSQSAPRPDIKAAFQPDGQAGSRAPVQAEVWSGDPAAFIGPPRPGPRKLTVRLKSQRFEYSEGGAVVHAGAVTSGSAEHPTPRGAYSVLSKHLNKQSGSYTNYFDEATPMPYALQFNGPFYIHEGWVTGRPESHGCVRLNYADARFVYERMRVGDRIAVMD